jgi:hypothetical protein
MWPRGNGLGVARGVLGDRDLERVLESARELAGARYAAIQVLDESRTAIRAGLLNSSWGRSDLVTLSGPDARQAVAAGRRSALM